MNSFYYSWTDQKSAVDFPVESAELDEFVLKDGRRVYDFISTSFQANFGHSDQWIKQQIGQQINLMPIASPKSNFELKSYVSNRLNNYIARGQGKLFYTVSGAESVENALKIARQMTGRDIILARKKSYHGATLGALSVTGDWRNDPHRTFDSGTVRIPEHDSDPDLAETKKIIESTGPENIAALILETISGTNGMSIPHQDWFAGIEALCKQHGILLIIDEVLVGFNRCRYDFAFHGYELKPDLVCMSKGITGGYIPFGAVWTSPEISNYYDDEVLCCGLTNYGHPLGLSATKAVLDLLTDPGFRLELTELEDTLKSELSRFEKRNDVREIRVQGMMAAIYFERKAPSWQVAFDAGLHLFSKNNLTIFAPPYISEPDRLKQAIQTFENLLD